MRTRFDWWTTGGTAVLCVMVGTAVVAAPLALAFTAAAVTAVALLLLAPLRWLAVAAIFGLLLAPTSLAPLKGVLPSDLALTVIAALALVRGRRVKIRPAHWLFAAFLLWGVLVTRTGAIVPFLHTFAPLAAGYLLGRISSPGDIWKTVRWWSLVCIITAPLLSDPTGRWTGLPGGPNELGLLAATLVVLAYASPVGGRWRIVQMLIGFGGLAATQSVSAGVGAVAGVLILRPRRNRRPTVWLSPLKIALVAGVAAVLAARPDLWVTVAVHSSQASTVRTIFSAVDPVTGGGWLYGAQAIANGLFFVTYDTVHNVYLQLLTDTGIIGLGLFLAALVLLWRDSDRLGRAVLVTVAVWLNTIGAYPNVAWALLGLVLAAAATNRVAAGVVNDDVRRDVLPLDVGVGDTQREREIAGATRP